MNEYVPLPTLLTRWFTLRTEEIFVRPTEYSCKIMQMIDKRTSSKRSFPLLKSFFKFEEALIWLWKKSIKKTSYILSYSKQRTKCSQVSPRIIEMIWEKKTAAKEKNVRHMQNHHSYHMIYTYIYKHTYTKGNRRLNKFLCLLNTSFSDKRNSWNWIKNNVWNFARNYYTYPQRNRQFIYDFCAGFYQICKPNELSYLAWVFDFQWKQVQHANKHAHFLSTNSGIIQLKVV